MHNLISLLSVEGNNATLASNQGVENEDISQPTLRGALV